MKTKNVSLIVIFSSLYVVINLLILPYSFGLIQCRLGDCLYPLISIFGMPCLIGCFIGQFVFNYIGYITGFALGELDLILSPLLFLIPKYIIYKLKDKPEIGVVLHIIFVSIWIPLLLNFLYGFNFILCIITVSSGEIIAEGIIGLILMNRLKKVFK